MILHSEEELTHSKLTYTNRELAISSSCLKTPIKSIIKMLDNCYIVDEEYFNTKVISSNPSFISKEIVVWNNKEFILLIDDISTWEIINLVYSVLVADIGHKILSRSIEHNNKVKTDLQYSNILLKDVRGCLVNKNNIWNSGIRFCDIELMGKELKRLKIKSSRYGEKLVIEFNNIVLGNEAEGLLTYKKIYVFFSDWKIDGWLLRFKNFDYSSYWDMDVILHPYLSKPYGFNDVITWLPTDDYEVYASSLVDLITQYIPESGLFHMDMITRNFDTYRKLWNGLRYRYSERLELSKQIFIEANNM